MACAAAVFVVSMRAVAGPGNSQPDGRGYSLLVFARASSEAEAERVAVRGLGQLGWIEAQAMRYGEITDPAAIPEDLQGSFAAALEGGCAVIVYDQP
jgi:hypothetical protein